MASSADNADVVEHAAAVNDIRVAEEQVARGEVVEHDDAKLQVLTRLAGEHDDSTSPPAAVY